MSRVILLFAVAVIAAHGQSIGFEWVRQIGGTSGQTVAGIATDPQGNVYVAGSTLSLDFAVKSAWQPHPGNSGLFRVDGAGAQWQNLYAAGMTAVGTLTGDPRKPDTLYATGPGGLSRSTDGGATWAQLGNFDASLNSVAVDPSAADVLYAATSGGGVSKSVDGGATWTVSNSGLAAAPDGKVYVYRLWVDPGTPSVVFASTFTGLARSGDAGLTWHMDAALAPGLQVGGMAFDPNAPSVVYLATGQGILKSADHGKSWTALSSPVSYFVPGALLVDSRHPGTVYAASGYTGIYRSSDGGNTWTNPFKQGVTALAADAGGNVYAGAGSRVVMSSDGFETATPVGPAVAGVTALLLTGGRLFVGAQAAPDVYVAKFDSQGNAVWATYFGGASVDEARAMTIDAGGSVYVTGTTSSLDFPVTRGAYAARGTSFVFKLNPDGSLAWSSFFQSTPNAIAVDSVGRTFIAGWSYGDLPVTDGAYQTKFQGAASFCCFLGPGLPPNTNAFLAAFDPTGASLVFSTYIGSYDEMASALELAPGGDAILGGGYRLYRMKGDGSALLASATVPGTVWALAIDGSGDVYAAGTANSSGTFPTTAGAFQTAPLPLPELPGNLGNSSTSHAFVARFDSQFNVQAATLLAGESSDSALALGVGADGSVLVGGATGSKGFPLHGAAQASFSTSTGFLAALTRDLSAMRYATFAGDSRTFTVQSVAAVPGGGLLFAGATVNPPYYALYNSYDPLFPSGPTAQSFLVRAGLENRVPRIDSVVNAASQLGVPLSLGETFQVRGDGFGPDAALLVDGTPVSAISRSGSLLTAVLPADFHAANAASVVVTSGGSSSPAFLAPVAAAAPGVFSVDGSGLGQGYILNEDGSLNSPSNPAKEGSKVTICATGVGSMTFDGPYAVTSSPVDVYIDGFYANGIAATLGPVAGLPGNVYQISVWVPHPADNAAANPNLVGFVMPPQVAVTLVVNGVRSQAGLALSVGQ